MNDLVLVDRRLLTVALMLVLAYRVDRLQTAPTVPPACRPTHRHDIAAAVLPYCADRRQTSLTVKPARRPILWPRHRDRCPGIPRQDSKRRRRRRQFLQRVDQHIRHDTATATLEYRIDRLQTPSLTPPACRPTLPTQHHCCHLAMPRRQTTNIDDSKNCVVIDSSITTPPPPSWHTTPTDSKRRRRQSHQRVDRHHRCRPAIPRQQTENIAISTTGVSTFRS